MYSNGIILGAFLTLALAGCAGGPCGRLSRCAAGTTAGTGGHAGQTVHLGVPFSPTRFTSLHALSSESVRHAGKTIRTRGVIESVCNEGRCWIDVRPVTAARPRVLVNSRKKAFSFPADSVGQLAEIEGRYFTESYPVKRLRHWAHHGWRQDLAIEGPMTVHRIEAIAVEIHPAEEPRK